MARSRKSPQNHGALTCACGRTFNSSTALEQHRLDSPRHGVGNKSSNNKPMHAWLSDQVAATNGEFESMPARVSATHNLVDKATTHVMRYANLRDEEIFPAFSALPDDNSLDLSFYTTKDNYLYTPRKHWCFFAQIVDIEHFLRLRLYVRDKLGKTVVVAMYTDGRGFEFESSLLQPGHTVAILYAHQHGFLDFTTGIRQEEYTGIKVKLLAVCFWRVILTFIRFFP